MGVSKLFPPQLEGKLAAVCGNSIKINYGQNRAVGISEYSNMNILIKTVSTNKIIYEGCVSECVSNSNYIILNLQENNINLIIGQYYKIQLAFIDQQNNVGYYSSVGVIKYTSEPKVLIENLNFENINNFNNIYQGHYITEDIAEKVYKYSFVIYDINYNIVNQSGELLHNSANDTNGFESYDIWETGFIKEQEDIYYIQYSIVTLNGLKYSSALYQIAALPTYDINLPISLSTVANHDEGTISIVLNLKEMIALDGQFVLLRSSERNNYTQWEQLIYFNLESQIGGIDQNNFTIFTDYTAEHGIKYKYAIQYCNPYGLFSNKIIAPEITSCEFEDMFLYDGERQLKLRFNPKVSNFKETVLETKTDTIGGPYPVFYRNGNVHYKEFNISALISMLMDDNYNFINNTQNLINFFQQSEVLTSADQQILLDIASNNSDDNYNLTNLTSINYKKERLFKLAVLNWLNNGKPKIFRSPAEGNYIIRLMNISLSPNDTLGRMLHTFTSTAYEIADYSLTNLKNLKFINSKQNINLENSTMIFNQYILSQTNNNTSLEFENECYYIEFNTKPYLNTIVDCYFKNGEKKSIIIGINGYFLIPQEALQYNPLVKVVLQTINNEVNLVVGYRTMNSTSDFEYDKITSLYASNPIIKQLKGQGEDISLIQGTNEEIEYLLPEANTNTSYTINKVYYLKAESNVLNSTLIINNNPPIVFEGNVYSDNFEEASNNTLLSTLGVYELYNIEDLKDLRASKEVTIYIVYSYIVYTYKEEII